MKRKRISLFKIFLITFLAFTIIFALALIFINANLNKEIDLSLVRTGSSVTRIYYFNKDEYGAPIGEPIELYDEQIFLDKSEWCSYYDMPRNLINAFVAVEDHRFFDHCGVDWLRTAKATFNYLIKFGKTEYGGSTITQQLIKNLTGDNRQTPKRKIEEILRAIHIEKNIGKIEILELYLNIVYLSESCYGVSSAAKTYFGKSVEELTLAECASLASIVKSPTKYDPYKNPSYNYERRKIVLAEMLDMGYISKEEYENAKDEEIIINSRIENENKSGIYSWYTELLIDDITKDLMDKYNLSKEGAQMMIFKGGLNIYTPIDPSLQNIAEKVFENYKAYLYPKDGVYPQGACIILDPYSSDVLAIIGGTGKKSGNRLMNRATQAKRPLGSVIKPLSVYAPAIEKRIISYSTVFDDVPMEGKDGFWPKNSPDVYHGLVDLEYSVSHSLNTSAVKALRLLGIDNSFNFLKNNAELTSLTQNDKNEAPLALGQLNQGESLMAVTRAYTMFSSGGYMSNSRSYYKITDNYGNILLEKEKEYKRVISEETASIMNTLLSRVTEEGTARATRVKDIISVAGKTGTSGNSCDKWFVGYTPYFLCGVWVGYDEPEPVHQWGVRPTINIFDAIMTEAHKNKDLSARLFSSKNVIEREYCRDSGKSPSESCTLDLRLNRINKGYFIKGTEPISYCELHKTVHIDALTGKIADNNTSYLLTRRIALLDYIRQEETHEIEILDKRFTIEGRQ